MPRRRHLAGVASTAAVGLLALAGPAAADLAATPSPSWMPDGQVNAIAVTKSTAYIGGAFNRIAPYTGGSAVLDPVTGKPKAPWPQVHGYVAAALSDGAGGWYLGGAFDAVGGIARQNLAHVRADGSLDPAWTPSVRGDVKTFLRRGTTLYVGGRFDQASGADRANLAAFDLATGALKPFAPTVGGSVNALALTGTGVYEELVVGGYFFSANGVPRRHLAAFNPDGGQITSFDPSPDDEVLSLASSDSTVYAGGDFLNVNAGTVRRSHLAAFDINGTATGWNPYVNGAVRTLQLSGSTLYAGGLFSVVNDVIPVGPAKARGSLAAFDTTTGVATSWAPRIAGTFFDGALTLDVAGSTVYVGGIFTDVNGGTARRNVAGFDATTGAVTAFDPDPDENGVVTVVAHDATRVIAGGSFRTLGGLVRPNLAAIDLTTGQPKASFDAKVGNEVNALALAGSKLWLGGWFGTVGGPNVVRQRLAAVDATTGAVAPFSQGIDEPVNALAVSGSTVYAGGRFTQVNGVTTRRGVAVFRDIDGTTGALTTFDAGVDGPVNALSLANGRLYLGGAFGAVRGAPRANLAAVDPGTGAPSAYRADVDGPVRALAATKSTLFAGGDFTAAGGTGSHSRLVALDAATAAVRPWDLDADAPVRALAFAGSQLVAGGDFGKLGGAARSYLAALDPATGAIAPWAPTLTTSGYWPVRSLAGTDRGGAIAGGVFTVPSGPVLTENLAIFAPGATATATAATEPAAAQTTTTTTTTDATPRAAGNDRTAPRLSSLRAAGRRITIALDEPADVLFTARGRGRMFRFHRALPAGRWRLAIRTRELGAGRYRLRAVPVDVFGNRGAARTIRLRIGR